MGKESGLGAAYYVDGIEVSGDTQSFERIANILSTLPMTGIDKFAMERKPGALNGEINWTAFFNPATDETHDTLGALPRTDRIVTYCHKRAGAMIPAASMVAKQLSYDPNRSMDGALLFKVNSSCNLPNCREIILTRAWLSSMETRVISMSVTMSPSRSSSTQLSLK